LVAEVAKHTDHVDILFANAGASWGASFDKTPENTFNKVMDLNVKSVFLCVQKYVETCPNSLSPSPANTAQIRSSAPQEGFNR
jgi:NAD(P)-dependent dehydrogenase (short-subunit alcohol dehydrogenase family)